MPSLCRGSGFHPGLPNPVELPLREAFCRIAAPTTFFAQIGLRFINADILGESLQITTYEAAEVASAIRTTLVSQRESFIFETVLSDPVGDKVDTLANYAVAGYTVVLLFIRLNDIDKSIERVAIRVAQGGYDVPDEKLRARFERTRVNLQRAIDRCRISSSTTTAIQTIRISWPRSMSVEIG